MYTVICQTVGNQVYTGPGPISTEHADGSGEGPLNSGADTGLFFPLSLTLTERAVSLLKWSASTAISLPEHLVFLKCDMTATQPVVQIRDTVSRCVRDFLAADRLDFDLPARES